MQSSPLPSYLIPLGPKYHHFNIKRIYTPHTHTQARNVSQVLMSLIKHLCSTVSAATARLQTSTAPLQTIALSYNSLSTLHFPTAWPLNLNNLCSSLRGTTNTNKDIAMTLINCRCSKTHNSALLALLKHLILLSVTLKYTAVQAKETLDI